jgi:hypothetical protein
VRIRKRSGPVSPGAPARGQRPIGIAPVTLTIALLSGCLLLAGCGTTRVSGTPAPSTDHTHVPARSTTPTATTASTASVLQASTQLAAFAAAEAATDSAAAIKNAPSNPYTLVHSDPVADRGRLVAVVASSYDPGGHPVQVLGYTDGSWSPLARLAAPSWQPGANVPPGVLYLLPDSPISVGDVTGDGRPDFLILLQAADNTPGFVVTQNGGSWHYATFEGAAGTAEVVGRNPQIEGSSLVSEYDNCTPDCAQGQISTQVWTYRQPSGPFTAPSPAG